jgi:glycosyltransferase involved in cell wall biosynthesis
VRKSSEIDSSGVMMTEASYCDAANGGPFARPRRGEGGGQSNKMTSGTATLEKERPQPAVADRVEKQRSICFIAPQTYSIFVGDPTIRVVGGAQVQQSLLARAFVKRGHRVSMISLNYGQEDGIVVDGVTIIRAHAPTEGVPGFRFFHPRLTSVWNAMRRADADIYYQRSSGALTAFMVAFAKRHKRLSVYAGASDRDFFATSQLPIVRDRLLFQWGLRNADLVIAQTEVQQQACTRNFGRESSIVRSCYDHAGQPGDHRGPILWVGNILPVKRAELFVELARLLPNHRFKMIGGSDDALIAPLRARAEGLTNLEFAGFVPFVEVESHFDGASLLINTSSNEGFPNTFLQAWSRGIPTVSTFDPHTYLDGARVGEVCGSVDDMARMVCGIRSNPMTWAAKGEACRKYFLENYSVSQAIDSYEKCFTAALG